ncbi:PREDICTED: X antigen family member 5-like [Miniopterus natalensis]|uniref:X antigen family member 5-like n=1 Tax=Miniopterus natalensis TaxID=291302 RepID=UPI0007A6B5D0|nr:PREDICTED: X antigen family member 5-like [Miniopterus natalensis]
MFYFQCEMSRRVRTTSIWKIKLVENGESAQPAGPVVDQQPSDEQPQKEESSTETQNITPHQEKGDAGASEVQGTDLEADLQELVKPKTGGEGGDDPEVLGHTCANLEPTEMPKTGILLMKNAI